MNKNVKVGLLLAALAVAAYFGYRWWTNRQAGTTGSGLATGSGGSQLSSVAPELVGGSAGPNVGPAVAVPVNITLSDSTPAASSLPESANGNTGRDMESGNRSPNPVHRQRHAGVASGPPLVAPPVPSDGNPVPSPSHDGAKGASDMAPVRNPEKVG